VLRDAFEFHLEETRGHIERLQVFEGLGEKLRGKDCDGLIEEGRSMRQAPREHSRGGKGGR
jgi:ferritin-like metal-binding protein YciE